MKAVRRKYGVRWQSSAATPLSRVLEKLRPLERGFTTPDSPASSERFQVPKEKRRGGLAAFPPHSIGAMTGSHGIGSQPGPAKGARSVVYPNSKASGIGLAAGKQPVPRGQPLVRAKHPKLPMPRAIGIIKPAIASVQPDWERISLPCPTLLF